MQSQSRYIVLVLFALLVSACGGQPAASPAASGIASAVASADTAGMAASPEPSTAAETASASVAASTATGATRMVRHAMGETAVPIAPQRVVTLDIGELDAALALGIKPVGSVTTFDDGTFPAYLGNATDGITVVGTIGEANLEQIVALKPDLILSSKSRDEDTYELLSQIAPTVLAERLGDSWKDNFSLYAEALGKADQGAALLADYEQRLSTLPELLGARPDSLSVSIVRFVEGGQTRVYHPGSFVGSILSDAGFTRPAAQQQSGEVWTEASKELIEDLDGDVIFYGVYGNEADSPLADYQNDPLWQQLGAVENGRVYPVPDEYWFVALGLGAANRVLDDIEAKLAGAAAPTGAGSAPAVQVIEATSEGRLVRHPLGETRVPLEPQRVVTLIPGGGVDYLLTYGIVPVAAADYRDFGFAASARPFYYDLVDYPAGVEADTIVGLGCCAGSYSIERIVAAQPDLIIGWTYQMEDIYEQLSGIAPTVALEPYNGPDWIEAGRVMAAVLGREVEHDAWLAEWQAALTSLRAEYGDPNGMRVTIVNAFDPAKLRMYGSASQPGQIARAAGFQVTEPPAGYDASVGISVELLPTIDADVIFVTTNFFKPEDWERFENETYGNAALWRQLKAVQAGRVYPVDTFFWTNGGPAANTQLVLPDLFRAAFKGEAPRVWSAGGN